MSIPNAADLAQMRAESDLALTDTCTIRRYTSVSDSEGGATDTWVDNATSVPCRVSPVGQAERIIGQRLAAESQWIVRFTATRDITVRDRIVWDGRTLEVTGVADRTDETSTVVAAREVA